MIFTTLIKKFICWLSLIILFFLINSPAHAAWKWTYVVKKATIEGIVLIDKRFQGTIKSHSEVKKRNRNDFFNALQEKYENYKPLKHAKISFVGKESIVNTDEEGYFKINSWWLSARKKEVQVTAPRIEITFNLDLDSLSNLFFIRIPNDGSPQILSLKATKEEEKPSNAVVLVHGFGVDIGPFTPSRHTNSWEKAYNLFKKDSDLSNYDFYMPGHWDDQSLVKSSRELGCFLNLLRRAYSPKAKIIVLAHSAGGLIVRHYTVSKFYTPGTVDRYLMLSTPNGGSMASLLHLEPSWVSEKDMDGHGSAATQILSNSDFLDCLNNKSKKILACKNTLFINKNLQGYEGINPDIPCAIVAGEIKNKIVRGVQDSADEVKTWVKSWLGSKAGEYANQASDKLNKMLDKIPRGDILVSLENQLIKGVPFILLPYPHGFIHRPDDGKDPRYKVMKQFILTGNINGISHL